MSIQSVLINPCEIYYGDNQFIGYTSGGLSFKTSNNLYENTIDQSNIVDSIIVYNHQVELEISIADWDYEQLTQFCPYLEIDNGIMSFPQYYECTEPQELKLLFDCYIMKFPKAVPILYFDYSYNKEDIHISNITFKIITEGNYFSLSNYIHKLYSVKIGSQRFILANENNKAIEEQLWTSNS